MSAAAANRDGYGVLGVGPQGRALRVVGEGLAAGSQVVDQLRGPGGPSDLAGLIWIACRVFAAVEQCPRLVLAGSIRSKSLGWRFHTCGPV